jgi:hypothetical protein
MAGQADAIDHMIISFSGGAREQFLSRSERPIVPDIYSKGKDYSKRTDSDCGPIYAGTVNRDITSSKAGDYPGCARTKASIPFFLTVGQYRGLTKLLNYRDHARSAHRGQY